MAFGVKNLNVGKLTPEKCGQLLRGAESVILNKSKNPKKANTWLHRWDDGTYRVQYHDTFILTVRPDGYEINTDGWFTYSTKERLNELGGLHIFTNRRDWWAVDDGGLVSRVGQRDRFNANGKLIRTQPVNKTVLRLVLKYQFALLGRDFVGMADRCVLYQKLLKLSPKQRQLRINDALLRGASFTGKSRQP